METDKEKNQNNLLKGYNLLLYFAGSMIMYEPTEECVVDFWSKGILNALPVSSSNPRFIEAASQLRNSCNDKTQCRRMLQEDYNKLFSDSELALARPVESTYLKNEFLLNGKLPFKVSDFYNSYGWKSSSRIKVPDDHLGTELLFLTLLVDKHIALDDEACRKEMKNEIRRFIGQHILSWIPEWNEQIQKYAETLCYKGIATLIYACSEDIFSLLDNNRSDNFRIEFKN
jgi:TorA maturation chaperone TorD